MRGRRHKIEIESWLAASAGLAVALVVQTAFIPGLLPGVSGIEPVYGLAVCLAILGHRVEALAAALAGCLALYALTVQFIGLNALSLSAVALSALAMQKNLVKDTLVAPAAIMFGGYILKELIYLFVLISVGLKLIPARVAAQLAFSAVVNTLLGSAVYWLLHFKLGLRVRVD